VLNDSGSVLDGGGGRATLAIGPFRLDVDTATLYRGNDPLPVGRRAVALLSALAKRQGLVVSKDELIQAAWSGLVVEESNLSVQIAALRKALAAEPGGEGWIETLPRRGYRFVGPTTTSSHHSAIDEE
jgi:DNA-binding winged helix-turn-helix (wHTH) protein